jgi:hypothetical protein
MASLSNINGLFDVHSTGAILFSDEHGTTGQILRSNGDAAPTWVAASTVIGGPYLPIAGGVLEGATSTDTGISFTVGGDLVVSGITTLNTTLTGKSATFVRDASGYSLRLDSADATTDNDLRFAKGGTDYAAIQIDAAATSDFQFYVNDGTSWINTLNFARADGQATFTKLVSGITPTAAANFTTKAYVDAIDHGVTQITAGTNVTITPVGGTGNVTINANTQGDITALTLGNGLTGTSLTGPIPDVLMSGSYAGKFTIDSTGDVEYLVLNTTSTTSKRVRLQFTQNDNAGIELGSDYSNNGGTDFYFYDRVAGSVMFLTSQSYSFFPANLGIGITTAPSYRLHVSGTGYISGATLIGGTLTVTGEQYFNGTEIQGDGKVMFRYSDVWLRINPDSDFSGGIYCGAGILRTDGRFEVGSGGTKFLVTAAGAVTAESTLTLDNGQIVLGGTGRIQGVDTVSATTDAANKAYVDAHPDGTVKGTGTATRVAFWSAGDTLSNNSTFYWDTTNNRLAIGMTSTPSAKLHVSTTGSASSAAATGIDVVAGTGGANCLSLGSTHHNWFPFSNGDNYYSAGIHNFRNAAHSITFATIASNSVFYNSVAIGQTAQPTVKLEVTGSNHFVTFQNTSTTANHYAQMMIKAGSATNYIWTANQNSTSWGGANSLNLYTAQAGAIAFFTTAAERMRITPIGQVVINSGTLTTPAYTPTQGYPLHVQGTSSQCLVSIGRAGQTTGSQGMFVGLDTLNAYLWNRDNTSITFGHDTGGTKMSILYTGNVGIGTTSPDYQLDIENSSHAVVRIHAGVNSSASLRLKNDAQDWDLNTQTNDTFAIYNQTTGTQPFSILPNGKVGIGVTGPSATLQVESVGGNGDGGDTDYQILAKSSTTSGSHQSTLGAIHPGDGYANLNLGSNASGLKFWHISKRTSSSSHRIEMYYNSGSFVNLYTFETNGTFTAAGDIVAYSDKRLKSNIKTLDGSKVLKMRGVSFEKDGKKGSGVIAQELEKVAPELVHNELEYKGVAYGNLVGYLIEAIKELELRVKELENK